MTTQRPVRDPLLCLILADTFHLLFQEDPSRIPATPRRAGGWICAASWSSSCLPY